MKRKDYLTAVRVADGLKARPIIRWSYLEKDEDFKELVEAESLARLDHYVKGGIPKLRLSKPEKAESLRKPRAVLSPGTLAIHFYFRDDKGFAFVEDAEGKIECREFRVSPLLKSYQKFISAYVYDGFEYVFHKALGELLQTLGETFKFLWELEAEKLLFVPYGFLHLLPFHGAWCEEHGFLFEKFAVGYLPARSFAELERNKGEALGICIENFKDHDFSEFLESLKKAGIKILHSEGQKVCFPKYPKNLIFISHGKANPANPFESRLELNPPLTFKEILKMELYPERVFLIACEADLDYAPRKPVDEYLSLSTVFLAKGAQEVVGTLWKVRPKDAEHFYCFLFSNQENQTKNIIFLHKEWLKEKIVRNRNSRKASFLDQSRISKALVRYLPFRIYTRRVFRTQK